MNQLNHSPPRLQGQRRLEQAIDYVARAWFPANPDILSKIQKRAELDQYVDDFEGLLADLKSDFSIFTYVLKEMRDLYPEDSVLVDPIALMQSIDIGKILSMLSVSSDAISRHSFLAMEKVQAARLKHFILGCSTSELLADKTGHSVDSQHIFTISAVRQLGLNLVAWNYPSIYGRVLQSFKDGAEGELDKLLSAQLGFEPIELATALTLPPHIREHFAGELGLVSSRIESAVDDNKMIARKLCEIGEAFAILNDPENYPGGSVHSQTSIREIESILGPTGPDQIRRAVNSRYVTYLTGSPELARVVSGIEKPARVVSNSYGKALSLRNPYMARLSSDLRKHLAEIYLLINKGQVSTAGIQKLATEVLPSIGFERGCIFLLEQNDLTLTPRLRIGSDSLKRYRALSCLDSGMTGNPVVDAFSCSFPIKQMGTVFLGERASLIAGVLGVSERAGVLYLEMTEELAQNASVDVLGIYKAVRQSMNDCLNLK